MNRAVLQIVIACALALVIGFAAGSMGGFSSGGARTESSEKDTTKTAPSPDVNEPLARAVKTGTGANRWLLLVSSAEKATAKDMPGIVRAAGDDNAAVRMLGAHWATLDPEHMFASLYAEFLLPENSPAALPQRYALVETLFEEWTKSDPAAVVKALNDVPSFSGRENLRHTVVNQLMKTDVEAGLRAMSEWSINNYIPDMKQVAAWAARDPRRATEVAAKYSQGYAAREVLKHIGQAWGASDPESGLRFAATLPAASRAALGPEILRHWAGRDLAAAAHFTAAQTDLAFRNVLAQGLVGAWAKEDPAAALEWSHENLRGMVRAEAIGGIVKSAAEKDLATAGELIAGMEVGPAQNRAAASLFEVWFNKGKDQRDAAFEWLAALPDDEARRAAFERVQWNWIWNDPQGARDFITGPHGHLASRQMIEQVARSQAAKNPEAALEWASKLPADRVADTRAAVLESWMQIRPEAAANFARGLPAGDERNRAVQTVTLSYAWQAPEQAGAWLRTLPESEQKTALANLTHLPPPQRQKIEEAMKKPAR